MEVKSLRVSGSILRQFTNLSQPVIRFYLDQWPLQKPKLEVSTVYIRPTFQAYVREHPPKYGQQLPNIWYSISIYLHSPSYSDPEDLPLELATPCYRCFYQRRLTARRLRHQVSTSFPLVCFFWARNAQHARDEERIHLLWWRDEAQTLQVPTKHSNGSY